MFVDQFHFNNPTCLRADDNLTRELQVGLDSKKLIPVNTDIALDEPNANTIRRRSKAIGSEKVYKNMIVRLSATGRFYFILCLMNGFVETRALEGGRSHPPP